MDLITSVIGCFSKPSPPTPDPSPSPKGSPTRAALCGYARLESAMHYCCAWVGQTGRQYRLPGPPMHQTDRLINPWFCRR
jgi:hypothetical protein